MVYYTYVIRAMAAAGAIVLVYDDRILDIVHEDVLEKDVPCETGAGSRPRLDPHPVLRGCESCSGNRHVLHSVLIRVLAEAPDASTDMVSQ